MAGLRIAAGVEVQYVIEPSESYVFNCVNVIQCCFLFVNVITLLYLSYFKAGRFRILTRKYGRIVLNCVYFRDSDLPMRV